MQPITEQMNRTLRAIGERKFWWAMDALTFSFERFAINLASSATDFNGCLQPCRTRKIAKISARNDTVRGCVLNPGVALASKLPSFCYLHLVSLAFSPRPPSRARRIKCDEGRPACSRCTSTGRTCEGYGIWGGGRNIGSISSDKKSLPWGTDVFAPRPPAPISVLAATTQEKEYFDWFKTRTLHRLSGSFISRFWKVLVIQASFQEPAVMHAVLALSAIHRRGVVTAAEGKTPSMMFVRSQDHFALAHYLQAIQHLRTHFDTHDKASFRVALMTCILFVTFDFFRGHFEAGQCHLKSGLRILSDLPGTHNDFPGRKPSQSYVDDWILEAFSRLQFQVELFKLSYQGPCLTLSPGRSAHSGMTFQSVNECWYELQRLINNILQLDDHCHKLSDQLEVLENFPTLFNQQRCLQNELEQWLYAFQPLKVMFNQGRMGYEEKKAYKILPVYHNMATIMAGVCLSPGDESAFDTYSTQFVVIVSQMTELWAVSQPAPLHEQSTGHQLGNFLNMAHCYADIGWIPALFYTAIKCRVHRVRLQAIRLLECSTHREGIWDSLVTACIARKAVQMEERDFYRGIDTRDSFPLSSCPTPWDLSLALVPSGYRIRRLDVVLLGEPMDRIIMFGEKQENNIFRSSVLSEYSLHTQSWSDRPESIDPPIKEYSEA
jgi:hypothetical protein